MTAVGYACVKLSEEAGTVLDFKIHLHRIEYTLRASVGQGCITVTNPSGHRFFFTGLPTHERIL